MPRQKKKPFLLLQSRPEQVTLDNEYEAFCLYSGLASDELVRVHLERDAIPYDTLDDFGAVFMGGGPANFAYDESEKSSEQKLYEKKLTRLMKIIIAKDKPFMGMCLGVGAIMLGLDHKMSFDYGESLDAVEIRLTGAGKRDQVVSCLPDTFLAVSGHKEGAAVVPQGVLLLAKNDRCPQIIRSGQNVYGVQFHPEIDEIGIRVRMEAYRHNGYFDPAAFEEVLENLMRNDPTSSQVLLKRFCEVYG